MRELVCLDLPLGDAFVARLVRAWEEGDAVFPLDQRLPPPSRRALVSAMGPTIIFDGTDDTRTGGEPVETGDAVVVATSGSTGEPKGVVLTMDAVTASARAVSGHLAVSGADKWFACLPPAHIGGLSVVMRGLVTGTPVVTAPAFTPGSYVDAARSGATLVSLVATALARVDASLYRTIVLGGSRPPTDLPPNCVTTYGLTETGSGVVYDGRPLPGVEVDVRDGIIHVRGPMLLRAYRDGSVPLGNGGWLRTGDVGRLDDTGRLWVQGREGDLIVTGGENVWPEQVESALATHPAVVECCVAGVDDPEWGSAVHAFVVTRTPVSLADLRDHVKSVLPAHCAPKALHVVDGIPRTALGKPRRSELVASVSGADA